MAKKKQKKTTKTRPRKARKTTRTARKSAPKKQSAAKKKSAAVGVTMKIDFGANPPSDVMSIRRIDGIALSTGRAPVSRGTHTAGWDVVSPTIRPIAFGVTITEDATGRRLLDRSQERTGGDGKGAGADRFTV